MARSLQDILAELKANFVSNTIIQSAYGLTPGNTFEQEFSIVSFEGSFLYIVAFAIHALEKNFDFLRSEVDQKIAEARNWSIPNFVEDAYGFQYGDELEFDPITMSYRYPTINEENRIIKVASATEVSSELQLKIATDNGSGIEQLSIPQLTAFSDYITKLKAPGVNLAIISRPADTLKIYYHIYVNAQVLNTSGELISNPSVRPVEDAIKAYCVGLDFNGVFNITELTDLIQQIPGVVAPVFDEAHAKFGTLPYSEIQDFYTPNSGYLAIDPAFPLSVTVTYQIQ